MLFWGCGLLALYGVCFAVFSSSPSAPVCWRAIPATYSRGSVSAFVSPPAVVRDGYVAVWVTVGSSGSPSGWLQVGLLTDSRSDRDPATVAYVEIGQGKYYRFRSLGVVSFSTYVRVARLAPGLWGAFFDGRLVGKLRIGVTGFHGFSAYRETDVCGSA